MWSHQSIETKEEIEVVVQFVIHIWKILFIQYFLSFIEGLEEDEIEEEKEIIVLDIQLVPFYVITTFVNSQ